MKDLKRFFEVYGEYEIRAYQSYTMKPQLVEMTVNSLYQVFEERRKAEAKEPECKHGHWIVVGIAGGSCPGQSFERYNDKHCRDCGIKL